MDLTCGAREEDDFRGGALSDELCIGMLSDRAVTDVTCLANVFIDDEQS